MSRITRFAKPLLGIGVLLVVLELLGLFAIGAPLGSLAAVTALGLPLIAFGAVLYGLRRFGVSVPSVSSPLPIDRQDIVASTNWSRLGKYALRRSFGIALAVSSSALLLLTLVLQETSLSVLFAILAIVGVVWTGLAWRAAHGIVTDETRTVDVRVPESFAVHSFHIALRQRAEDLGYRVVQDRSPSATGDAAPYDPNVFHAEGGFKARKRPIDDSTTILPDVEDETLSQILTVATAGVFAFLLGITLVVISDALTDPIGILGGLLVLIGVCVVTYDYLTRTREWAELYCVEEGTVYATDVNEFDDDQIEAIDSRPQPTVVSPEAGAVLSVTVGAKCTSLYDEPSLHADFDELAEAVESAATTHHLNVFTDDERETVVIDNGSSIDSSASDRPTSPPRSDAAPVSTSGTQHAGTDTTPPAAEADSMRADHSRSGAEHSDPDRSSRRQHGTDRGASEREGYRSSTDDIDRGPADQYGSDRRATDEPTDDPEHRRDRHRRDGEDPRTRRNTSETDRDRSDDDARGR